MDLTLYAQVLWRFRLLVLGGLAAAIALAILAMVRVDFSGGKPSLTYRKQETWTSNAVLLITQNGFPEGRAIFPTQPQNSTKPYPYADPGRLQSLGDIYSSIANSDAVQQRVKAQAGTGAAIAGSPIAPSTPGTYSPLMRIVGTSTTAGKAVATTQLGTKIFLDYLKERQDEARIPDNQRVDITVLTKAGLPTLVNGRKKTLPIVVFVAVMSAAIALAFVLENARPRVRVLQTVPGENQHVSGGARRSA